VKRPWGTGPVWHGEDSSRETPFTEIGPDKLACGPDRRCPGRITRNRRVMPPDWSRWTLLLPLAIWRPKDTWRRNAGYLYLILPPAKLHEALRDRTAIGAIAGKPEAIGFGLRYIGRAYHPMRLRQADEAPKVPDVHVSAEGDLPGRTLIISRLCSPV
jgi:hypothetical protein